MQTVHEATELTEQQPPKFDSHLKPDFDPCSNAKITSPFYLYNHDSPRPSFEVKNTPEPKVSIQDLEAGSFNLTPTVSEEKRDAQAPSTSKFTFWQKKNKCMTQPKQRGCGWLARLPQRQRIAVKLLIALVIIGAAVGIAVGISIRVGGGVYKNNNSTENIG